MGMDPVTIRRALPDDAAACAETIAASIGMLCKADHHGDPAILSRWLADKTPAGLAARIAGPGRVFVAECRGAVVGVGEVEAAPHPPGTGRITLNYVAPAFRGQGISRALLAAMEADLRNLGRPEASLTATATARDFYLAHGWQVAAPPRQGRWIVGHPMRKDLNA